MNDQVEKLKRLNGELCKMLEERGVKCEVLDFLGVKAVVWGGNGCRWVALPDEGGLAVAVYEDYLTPEQAIAATLGSEREKALEQFIRDYHDATGDLLTEHDYLLACGFEQRMRELGIEVNR